MRDVKYYCDRCGNLKIGHPKITISVGDKGIQDIGWIKIRSDSGFANLDLCKDCLNDFKDWFDNKNWFKEHS